MVSDMISNKIPGIISTTLVCAVVPFSDTKVRVFGGEICLLAFVRFSALNLVLNGCLVLGIRYYELFSLVVRFCIHVSCSLFSSSSFSVLRICTYIGWISWVDFVGGFRGLYAV